jgi:drug/metabolite transporter (DMT)-like permease
MLLVAWQILAVVFAGAGLCSEVLSDDDFIFPAFQSLCCYGILFMMWAPVYVWHKRNAPRSQVSQENLLEAAAPVEQVPFYKRRHFFFASFSFLDFQSLYCLIFAYQFTSMVSVQLLDSLTLPVVMCLSVLFLCVGYKLHQVFAAVICVIGVVMMAVADILYNSTESSSNYILGDALILVSATLTGACCVMEDSYCNSAKKNADGTEKSKFDIILDICFWLSVYGCVFSFIQMLVTMELFDLLGSNWESSWGWALFGFAVLRASYYTAVPILLQYSGATIMTLSLLTADFWTFLVAVVFYDFTYSSLYLVGMITIIVGILLFCVQDLRIGKCWRKMSRRFRSRFERQPVELQGVDSLRVVSVLESARAAELSKQTLAAEAEDNDVAAA